MQTHPAHRFALEKLVSSVIDSEGVDEPLDDMAWMDLDADYMARLEEVEGVLKTQEWGYGGVSPRTQGEREKSPEMTELASRNIKCVRIRKRNAGRRRI